MTEKHYTIFKTKWGYMGLAGSKTAIFRLCLPLARQQAVEQMLLESYPTAINRPNYRVKLQRRVSAYFSGGYEDFRDVEVDLSQMTDFGRIILEACRKIPYGETFSYERLAKAAERPKAVRAVGSVMAKNPIPLIIPCHRVIRKNGLAGQFSAFGGTNLKLRLLELENPETIGDIS